MGPTHPDIGAIIQPRLRSLFDWTFRSRVTGRITIGQFPNVALWCYLAAVVAGWVLPRGADTTVGWIQAVTLGWWALDEVVRGVNPWRRVLGVAGCWIVASNVVGLLS